MSATNLKVWLPFDESPTADKCGNTWTATGNVSLSTTITKNGSASVHLPSGAYLTANNVIDLNADKWTFDCWCYCVSSSSNNGFFGLSAGASRRGIIANNDGVWVASSGGGSWQNSNSNLLFPSVKNQWVHLAIVKDGTSLNFYQDGVNVWAITTSRLNDNDVFTLGGNSYGYGNDLYFDEVRFYEGTALWAENFTPPTAEDYIQLALDFDGEAPFTLNADVVRKVIRSRKPVAQYVSFTGQSGSYGALPLEVLPGAKTFTIEIKLASESASVNRSDYLCPTILGRTGDKEFGIFLSSGKLGFWANPAGTRTTVSSAVINDGNVHKIAVVSNTDGAIDLYCDGVNVAHTDNANVTISSSRQLYFAWNSYNSNSLLQMDLYEARFWSKALTADEIFSDLEGDEENLEAWYIPSGSATLVDSSINKRDATLYGSPNYTYLETLPLELTFDVERKLNNRVELTFDIERRVWKRWFYVNLGDADDLITASTILTDLPETESKTGTAFYQTTRAKCFDLPATPEIWIKFDVYFNGKTRWRAFNGGDSSNPYNAGITAQSSDECLSLVQNSTVIQNTDYVCPAYMLQSVLLHMVSGSSAGVIEAWVDGEKIYTFNGDVNHGEGFEDIYLQSDGAGTFFSNVIISNVEISSTETGTLFRLTADFERTLNNASWTPVSSLKVWLPFNRTITEDLGGNEWEIPTPSIYTASLYDGVGIHGTALRIEQYTGNYYNGSERFLQLTSGITLGGRNFTIKGWFSLQRKISQTVDCWCVFCLSSASAGGIFAHSSTIALGGNGNTLCSSCLGETTRITTLQIDKVYAFELVYLHGAGKFFVFIDGEKVSTVDVSIPPTFFPTVYIDYAKWNPEQPLITIDEFRIYDGTALHTENFAPPTAETYIGDTLALEKQCPFMFVADIVREIENARPAFYKSILFYSDSTSYGLVPLEVLAGATVFTIEVTFLTNTAANSATNYTWKTLIGREIGGNWQDDFGLCVNNGKLCFWAEPKTGGTSGAQDTLSYAIVNDADIHRVAIVSNPDGTIVLYCDGEKVAHNYLAVNAKITDEYQIGVSHNINNNSSSMMMRFYEARFWNIPRTRDEIFTDIDGGGVLFSVIQGNEDGLQAWNVPDARTDIIPDLTGKERHITIFGDADYNFVYEIEFTYYANIEREVYFLLEGENVEAEKHFNLPPTYEIWIDVDVWFDGEHLWKMGNASENGVTGAMSQTTKEITFLNCDEIIQSLLEICNKKELQNVLLHMKANATEGLIEARVDGKPIYSYTGEVNRGEPFEDIFLYTGGGETYFSSYLISTSGTPPLRRRIFWFDVERWVLNASVRWKISGTGAGIFLLDADLGDPDQLPDGAISPPYITKLFDLPPTYEIWIDFDVYFDGVSRWRAGNINGNGICGITALATSPLLYLSNNETVQAIPNVCKAGKVQPILLHMYAGEEDGIIETWVNGEKLYTYTGDVNHGEVFADLFLQCDTTGTYFSNITFSSYELEPRSYIEPIYFCVRHNGEILSFPLRDSDMPITNAFAVRYGEKNWYNTLKAPTDETAGVVHVWHNGTEYALSKTLF